MPFAALTTVLGAARYSLVGVAVAVMPAASPTAGACRARAPPASTLALPGSRPGGPRARRWSESTNLVPRKSREEIVMSTAEALNSLVSDGQTDLREGYADV